MFLNNIYWMFSVQETKTQYIIEIEFCLDLKLNVMTCPTQNRHQQAAYGYQQDGRVVMVQRQGFSFGETRRCADTEPVAYNVIRHS